MLGPLFAILSVVGYGVGQFLVQLGLRNDRVSATHGMVINLLAGTLALAVARRPRPTPSPSGSWARPRRSIDLSPPAPPRA